MIISDSLNGEIAGSHYNHSWYVHEVLSEALERIFLARFLAEKRPTKDPLSYSEAVVHNSEEFFIFYGDYFQSMIKRE